MQITREYPSREVADQVAAILSEELGEPFVVASKTPARHVVERAHKVSATIDVSDTTVTKAGAWTITKFEALQYALNGDLVVVKGVYLGRTPQYFKLQNGEKVKWLNNEMVYGHRVLTSAIPGGVMLLMHKKDAKVQMKGVPHEVLQVKVNGTTVALP